MPNPNNTDRVLFHCQRAVALSKLRKLDAAAKEARKALQLDPQYAEAHHLLGVIYMQQGKLLEAKKELQIALRLIPDEAEFHNTFAALLGALGPGSLREAIEHHKQALALKPDVPGFHWRYGLLLASCGDLNAAWQETEVCLRLNPDYADAHLLQAEILRRQENFSEAEKSTLLALAIEPEEFEAHDLLGDIYLETHRAGKALACYRSALRLDPTHKPLKRKVILALQARIPFWGVFWKISSGLDRFSNRRIAEAVILAMVVIGFLLVTTGDVGSILMTCIYCVPIVVPLGLLIWVVDPMLTRAFLDGRIKIDETADSNPKVETNTRLARFIKVPFLLLVLVLTLLCSMMIFLISSQ